MKIHVLILTHNRPTLFKRCIDSVIDAFHHYNVDLCITVNNDSNDITEVYTDMIKYQYKTSDNLCDLYLDLYKQSGDGYVYFLEDDDILSIDFFEVLDGYTEDIFYFNYIPYKWSTNFLSFFKQTIGDCTKDDFMVGYNNHNFQFGQICFKKKCLDVNDFPDDNYIQNDFVIFKLLEGSFRKINRFMFTQTTDGGDNISFPYLNTDGRWERKE